MAAFFESLKSMYFRLISDSFFLSGLNVWIVVGLLCPCVVLVMLCHADCLDRLQKINEKVRVGRKAFDWQRSCFSGTVRRVCMIGCSLYAH